jgi:HEAT repeat protein
MCLQKGYSQLYKYTVVVCILSLFIISTFAYRTVAESDIDSLITTIRFSDREHKEKAAETLGKMGEKGTEAIPRLLDILDDKSVPSNDEIKYAVSIALAKLGVYKIEPILDYAKRKDIDQRVDIILVLKRIGDHQAIPILIDSLQSRNPSVRKWSLHTIGIIRDYRAYESVLSLLNDEEEIVKTQAIWTLCELPDSRSIKALRKIYQQNPAGDLRGIVIGALGVLHDSDMVEEFIQQYKLLNKNDSFRLCYARALGDLGDGRALDIIAEGFLDKKIIENDRKIYGIALSKIQDVRKSDSFLSVWEDNSETKSMRIFASYHLVDSSSPKSLEAAKWLLENGEYCHKAFVIKRLSERLYSGESAAITSVLEYATKDTDPVISNLARRELDIHKNELF